jgi:hypothetical protein
LPVPEEVQGSSGVCPETDGVAVVMERDVNNVMETEDVITHIQIVSDSPEVEHPTVSKNLK